MPDRKLVTLPEGISMFSVHNGYFARECLVGSRDSMVSGPTCLFGRTPTQLKAYPEDPAEFKPLTEDELQRIKKERRQKEAQRKQKAAENRKHLANVRVVQKNLVFIVGLSQRLADTEVLKKHEYFGKFGKLHKVVINQSTSYAGAQGPSASAYVTYNRPEDALKAIQSVNNIHVDGRTLKASLGTTKYCSHFLRGAQCPKPDCMYLHELGEEAASFTKEEMQQGKHQEYEQKLYEMFMNSQNISTTTSTSGTPASVTPPVPVPVPVQAQTSRKKTTSPVLSPSPTDNTPPQTTNEAWPSLQLPPGVPVLTNTTKTEHRLTNGNKVPPPNSSFAANGSTGPHSHNISQSETQNAQNRAPGFHRNNGQHPDSISKPNAPSPDLSPSGSSSSSSGSGDAFSPNSSTTQQQFINRGVIPPLSLSPHQQHQHTSSTHSGPGISVRGTGVPPPPGLVSAAVVAAVNRKLPFQSATDSMSLFSSANGFPASRNPKPPQHSIQNPDDTLPVAPEIPETIPVSTSTDWQAAFGFSSSQPETHDDDLGFDPWNESAKALAEIIEKESTNLNSTNKLHFNQLPNAHSPHSPSHPHHNPMLGRVPPSMPQHMPNRHPINPNFMENRPKNLPPGFMPNHIGAGTNNQMGPPGSRMMNMMHFPSVPPRMHNNSTHAPGVYQNMTPHNDLHMTAKRDTISPQDWQDGLRALLPNINISFGAQPASGGMTTDDRRTAIDRSAQQSQQPPPHQPHPQHKHHSEETPHWMASLHHLTEDSSSSAQMQQMSNNSANSHQMSPLVQQLAHRNTMSSWPPQSGATHPPPGFHNAQLRPHTQGAPEVSQLAEGFL